MPVKSGEVTAGFQPGGTAEDNLRLFELCLKLIRERAGDAEVIWDQLDVSTEANFDYTTDLSGVTQVTGYRIVQLRVPTVMFT